MHTPQHFRIIKACKQPLLGTTHMRHKVSQWLQHSDYRTLLKNYSSLSLVQLSNYILPLLTLPYLARVLGTEHFGLIIMAQATMIYLTLLTDYGFNLSATKEIANHQQDKHAVGHIFSTIMSIKCGLLTIGAIILTILIHTIPLFAIHQKLFILSYLIVIGNSFLPTFLFQGLEKMSFIALFNFTGKVVFTGLIFIIIQSQSDYYLVHAIWGVSYILVDIGSIYIIINKLNIPILLPTWNKIKQYLHLSFEYFLSRIAIAIYLNANVILVGLILSPTSAGHYGGAEKLLFALTTFYAPLIETIYPYISRTKNKPFIKKIVLITSAVNTLGCAIAFFMAPIIVPIILGKAFIPSIPLFQWMLVVALLHLPTSMIGYPVLGALGYEKTANRSVIFGALVHIILLATCYPYLSEPLHFIWIMIVSQSIIFAIRTLKLMRITQLWV